MDFQIPKLWSIENILYTSNYELCARQLSASEVDNSEIGQSMKS